MAGDPNHVASLLAQLGEASDVPAAALAAIRYVVDPTSKLLACERVGRIREVLAAVDRELVRPEASAQRLRSGPVGPMDD